MGHEGTLGATAIMMTAFGCAAMLTMWFTILKSLSLVGHTAPNRDTTL